MVARESHSSLLRLLALGLAVALPLGVATTARAALAISKSATSNVTCSGGVCTATAAAAVLNTNDLKQLLAVSDVRVASGNVARDVVFNAPLKWTGRHRLTLDAYRSVFVRKPVISEGTGGVTVITDDGGKKGTFTLEDTGSITFWDLNSSFIVNGYGYRLVGDIATLAAYIAASPTSLYAMARNYDASADETYTSAPIPTAFTGVFEGLGHAVANLTMQIGSGSPSGMFALVQGSVRDFGLTQARMPGKVCAQAGLLAAQNNGTIVNAFATGSILCTSDQVTRGGLVGQNYGGTIDRSWAAVDINSQSAAASGGLVGENDGVVMRSHATGNVAGRYYAGGLVGTNGGEIAQSYATGNIDGQDYAGGLVGALGNGSIADCYATGAASGGPDAYVGGLVARSAFETPIKNSYATGAVTDSHYAGGLIGSVRSNSTTGDYWDLDTAGVGQGCGQGDCTGVIGLTTAQFQSGLPAGFDPNVWGENPAINGGFPYLLANAPG